MEIKEKKVIITGGAQGLGKQFALDLKARGAFPYIADVDQAKIDSILDEAGIPGKAADVSDEESVISFFEGYIKNNGAPDVMINNAGINSDALLVKKKDHIKKLSRADWQKVIDVNLTGVFLCGREAAAHMIRHGTKGLIINISSISRAGNFGQTNYSAAKAGVSAMTVAWSKELARSGIRVAAIAPGFVKTGMTEQLDEKIMDAIVKQIPLGRLGEKEEISRAVRFVIECDFVNGRTIEVDGGHRI